VGPVSLSAIAGSFFPFLPCHAGPAQARRGRRRRFGEGRKGGSVWALGLVSSAFFARLTAAAEHPGCGRRRKEKEKTVTKEKRHGPLAAARKGT